MNKGVLLAIISSIFIGMGTVIGTKLNKVVEPVLSLGSALVISGIGIFLLSLIVKEKIDFQEAKKFKKELIEISLFRTAIGGTFLYYGMSLTKAIHTAVLLKVEPLFVALASLVLLKEKISRKQLGLIILIVLSAIGFSTGLEFGNWNGLNLGDALIVLSVIFFSYTYFPAKKILEKINAITISFITNFVPGIFLFIIAIGLGFDLGTIIQNFHLVLAAVILFNVLGLYFFYRALQEAKPWIVSVILTLSVVVSGVFANVWLGETISFLQMIFAGALVLGSYLLSAQRN